MDNWLKNTNVIKVLSLVFGIMLWLLVGMSSSTTDKELPINVFETKYVYETEVVAIYDDNKYVVDMMTEKVLVTLKGTSSIIEKIREATNNDEGKIFINLENYSTGIYDVPIEYSGFPTGIDVSVEPINAHVNIEEKQTKEFNIIVEKLGKEKDGFQMGEPIINPKRVYISGTTAQIEQVSYVKAYVNIDNINSPISQETQLRAVDNNGNFIDVKINPSVVNIQIPISSPFLSVPLTYKINAYPPNGYAVQSINLQTDKVILYGDKEILDNYSVYSGLLLDLSNIMDNQTLTVDVMKNDDLLKVEPATVDIAIIIVNSIIREYTSIPIDIIGSSDGFNVDIINQNSSNDLTVEAAPSVINSINAQDIQTFIDVSNLQPGAHKVLLQYNIPVLVKNIGEEKYIDVMITKE